MPELPEVEVVRRGLENNLAGKRIVHAKVLDPRSLKGQDPAIFERSANGLLVSEVVRRGKFLWLLSDEQDEQALLIHLGMSGQALVNPPDLLLEPKTRRHLRVQLQFEGERRLDFIDQRIFGRIRFEPLETTLDGQAGGFGSARDLLPVGLERKLGRDALDPALDIDRVALSLAKRKIPIKTALLDQSLVSGIGNIYADEALFASGINPLKPSCELSAQQVASLYENAAQVMRRALKQGGTSFDALYVDTDGNPGYFARSLNVYGRAGQSCTRCGKKLTRTVLGGRGTTFCEKCQC